jgi:hypothetical protein
LFQGPEELERLAGMELGSEVVVLLAVPMSCCLLLGELSALQLPLVALSFLDTETTNSTTQMHTKHMQPHYKASKEFFIHLSNLSTMEWN